MKAGFFGRRVARGRQGFAEAIGWATQGGADADSSQFRARFVPAHARFVPFRKRGVGCGASVSPFQVTAACREKRDKSADSAIEHRPRNIRMNMSSSVFSLGRSAGGFSKALKVASAAASSTWLAACAFLVAVNHAESSPISATSWKVVGDQKLTLDSNTGLEWLDIDQTLNKSYETVTSSFGTGGAYEGFRYATLAEFQALLANAGMMGYSVNSVSSQAYAEAAALQSLLSTSFSSDSQKASYGIFADPAISNFQRRSADLELLPPNLTGVFISDQTNFASESKGSWLVRPAAVPEPSTCCMAFAGLACGGYSLFRRRTQV